MKEYPKINGASRGPIGLPCIAFYKYDGSNLRFEWSKKRGFYKFGTRKRLFDKTDAVFGCAIDIFNEKYGDILPTALHKNKDFRNLDSFVAYCEFFGKSSFAGKHDENEEKDLVLFDVNIHKKGFITPNQLVKLDVPVAPVVYEGVFNSHFIQSVRSNKLDVLLNEGVVAKGVYPRAKNPHLAIWMVKVKTDNWINKLMVAAESDSKLQKELLENVSEQK